MDHVQDVERLFSWLKAPMVHYREFAPEIEVAAAVAAWPVVHRAAVQTGVADADVPGPHGDSAAHERIARERMTLPAAVVAEEIRENPMTAPTAPAETAPTTAAATPTPGRLADRPASKGVAAVEASAEPAAGLPPPVQHVVETPAMAGFEEPAPPAERRTPPVRPAAPAPERAPPPVAAAVRERNALFSGGYRGRERDARPAMTTAGPGAGPSADRQERSLDAVFSRLSGGRDRLPDPRARARTSPGLGAVFNRLR